MNKNLITRALLLSASLFVVFQMPCTSTVYAKENLAKEIKAGDVICFGIPDEKSGYDGKWLVLDNATTNTGTPGMFLTSLSLIGSEDGEELIYHEIGDVSVSFLNRGEEFAKENPGAQNYQGSEMQQWCEDFFNTHFSVEEQSAILPTYKSDQAVSIPGLGIPLPGATNGTVDFDSVDNILNGDRLFLLSAEEAYNANYGFTSDASRVAFYKGEAAGYWLRSPHIDTFPLDVGFVFGFGALMDYPVNGQFSFHMNSYARPAMNLDSTKITDLEVLNTENGTTVWRISMNGNKNLQEYDPSLPAVADTIDLRGMAQKAMLIVILALVTIVSTVIYMIVRHKKN